MGAINNQPMETINNQNVNLDNNVSYDIGKTKKKKFIPIILLLLLVVCAGVLYYYFTSKERIVKGIINRAFDMYESLSFNNRVDLDQSAVISGDLSFNTNIPEFEDLNSDKLNYVLGFDFPNKKIELGGSLEENGVKLLDAALYLLDNSAYVSFKDDYDKLIRYDAEGLNDFFTYYDNMKLSQEDLSYINKAFKKILVDSIDYNDFVKSSTTITLNGKNTKVTKLSYDMTYQRGINIVNNVIDGTLNDSKLLEILSRNVGISVDEVKSGLSSLKVTDTGSYSNDEKIIFDIYTEGFKNSFVGMDIQGIVQVRKNNDNITIDAGMGDEKLNIVIRNLSDESYTIEFTSNIDGEVFNGSIALTSKEIEKNVFEGNVKFDFNYNGSTFSIASNFNEKIGVSVADIDVSNSIDYDSITEEEYNQISEKILPRLQDSKIYNLINNYMNDYADSYGVQFNDLSSQDKDAVVAYGKSVELAYTQYMYDKALGNVPNSYISDTSDEEIVVLNVNGENINLKVDYDGIPVSCSGENVLSNNQIILGNCSVFGYSNIYDYSGGEAIIHQ